MFGIKRKKKVSPILSSIAEKVVYSMSEIDDVKIKRRISKLPRLRFGESNTQVPQEWLLRLNIRDRPYWPWLDFNKIFADKIFADEIREASKPEIPTSQNKFVQIGIKANEPVSVIET